MTRKQLAAEILGVSELEGRFTLRSGAVSDRYFDKYRFESEPKLLSAIAAALVPSVPEGTEALAGLELGGVPIATALSFETDLPVRFVRKKAKPYGTAQLAEGGAIAGLKLCVVEDVVTSGGQILESVAELRGLGAEITTALCVIDREAGGREALAAASIALCPLFSRSELEAARS